MNILYLYLTMANMIVCDANLTVFCRLKWGRCQVLIWVGEKRLCDFVTGILLRLWVILFTALSAKSHRWGWCQRLNRAWGGRLRIRIFPDTTKFCSPLHPDIALHNLPGWTVATANLKPCGFLHVCTTWNVTSCFQKHQLLKCTRTQCVSRGLGRRPWKHCHPEWPQMFPSSTNKH